MGIKQGLNEAFDGYVSNLNLKSDFTQHDSYVLDKIGYLKQVLSGERRKKEQGNFWIWESRIKEAQRVLQNMNKYSLTDEEVDVLNGMFDLTFKNKYFVNKFETASKDSDLCIISKNIAGTIKNYFDLYSRIKNIPRETSHNDNLETIASTEQQTSLADIGKGKTIVATVALLAAMGLSLFTGYSLANHANKKIIREKESRIEQLVQESTKPRMMILTDLPSEELDKRYEKYAQEEKAGRIPILDLRYSIEDKEVSKDSTEYYLNKGCNEGNFVKGFMYSTNKMQIPSENKKYTPEKKAELNKRFSNIDEKVRKEQKRFEQGIHEVVSLKHPVKGLWKTFTGFFGQMNGAARGLARPIAYFLTRNDRIDKAIDDLGDASYFGDSYNTLHENIFGLKFQKTRDFIKKHPVKSTISIAEDVFLWKWLHRHGDESKSLGGGGGSIPGIPGRSGGSGSP